MRLAETYQEFCCCVDFRCCLITVPRTMRSIIAFLAALSLCQARPAVDVPGASFVRSVQPYVIGGSNASPGEFPWQLSQTRGGSHSCGASLLNSRYGLSASHCVDGALPSSMTIIAGLWARNDLSGTQTVDVDGYTMHAEYNAGLPTYSNDIAILNFASLIIIGGNIQIATLPSNNNNDYAGTTCQISGWGLTDGTNTLPLILQKTSIPVITTAQCSSAMSGVGGANIWENHICVQDPAGNTGACNGDSGGPLNCPGVVVGVTSWVVSGGGNCLPSYPSVYTRISAYLGWILANTP
jgi:secreted trypsin-like serine protease